MHPKESSCFYVLRPNMGRVLYTNAHSWTCFGPCGGNLDTVHCLCFHRIHWQWELLAPVHVRNDRNTKARLYSRLHLRFTIQRMVDLLWRLGAGF